MTLNGRSSKVGFFGRRRAADDPLDAELSRSAYERGLAALMERVAPASARADGRGCSVALVSAERGQGATTAAANLAVFAAQRRRLRTLLIDASEGAPQLHRRFRIESHPGLAERLRGQATTHESVHATVFGRLDVLPMGDGVLPYGEEGAASVRALLEEARAEYALTVIDLGDMPSDEAPSRIAAAVDQCVLVVDPARSRRAKLEETAMRLRECGARLAGFVFNRDLGR